jgi:hypothetical protein
MGRNQRRLISMGPWHIECHGLAQRLTVLRVTAALMDSSGSLWLDAKCGYLRIPAADLANWTPTPKPK